MVSFYFGVWREGYARLASIVAVDIRSGRHDSATMWRIEILVLYLFLALARRYG
jgi:hypothetical protein